VTHQAPTLITKHLVDAHAAIPGLVVYWHQPWKVETHSDGDTSGEWHGFQGVVIEEITIDGQSIRTNFLQPGQMAASSK